MLLGEQILYMISECVTKYNGYRFSSFDVRSGGKTCTCWVEIMPGFEILDSFDGVLLEELEVLGARTFNTAQCHTSREALASILINTNVTKGILEICSDGPITRKRHAEYVIPLSRNKDYLDLYKFKRMKFFA